MQQFECASFLFKMIKNNPVGYFLSFSGIGRTIIRMAWSRVNNDIIQLANVFNLFLKFTNENKCTNSHAIQAINPLKNNLGFGISATALLLPIIAIEPLSLYLKAVKLLFCSLAIKFLARFLPCCMATCAN